MSEIKIEDYEQYWQKGGTYVLPIEIFNDLFYDIEQLQQENKNLKEKLDIADTNYDIIYDYFSKVNELLGTELCEEVLSEILKLKSENEELQEKLEENTKIYLHASKYASEMEGKYIESNYILTEFEKWLEENYCLYIPEIKQNSAIGKVYDKLQELKEGKK